VVVQQNGGGDGECIWVMARSEKSVGVGGLKVRVCWKETGEEKSCEWFDDHYPLIRIVSTQCRRVSSW